MFLLCCVQHHLRKFEEEFLKTHGRKVKYQKDIQPVAEDYQRYKVRRVRAIGVFVWSPVSWEGWLCVSGPLQEIKTALAAYKQ
jgi:hypothetical protein